MYKLKYGAPELYPKYMEESLYSIAPDVQKAWYFKIIYIYLYGGWRKNGIVTVEAQYINHNDKIAYNDYQTSSGSIIPKELRYSHFCLTKEDAKTKVLEIISKEINAKQRAIERLQIIEQNILNEETDR